MTEPTTKPVMTEAEAKAVNDFDMSGVQHEIGRLKIFAEGCGDTLFVFYARELPEPILKGVGRALVTDLNIASRHLIGLIQLLAQRYDLTAQDFHNIVSATTAPGQPAYYDEHIIKGRKHGQ